MSALCVAEKFMRDNIVGTVLVLSLVIWIPLVCVFQSIVSTHSTLVFLCGCILFLLRVCIVFIHS